MVFNSFVFMIFMIEVFVLRWFFPIGWTARKFILLFFSIIFYGAWRPEYLVLILLSTLVDWFAAKRLGASEGVARRRWLLVSLCSNLGMLAFFKYTNFFIENVNILSGFAFATPAITPLNILLPVGISFYTFQTLSYTIDVYRGTMKPWDSFWDFALFVTFFPQLVAGPIVRAVDFHHNVVHQQRWDLNRICWGFILAVWGMTQKIVLSDGYLADVVDSVYMAGASPGLVDAWVGTLAFSAQIYFDFAGYSLTAIGLSIALGFDLPQNFRAPYASLGFSDFWRRWHISLSTWLRDYLYISLGGNRLGHVRTYVNLFLTMLLGGIWHGASWNFVLWGVLHGLFLVGERLLDPIISSWGWARGTLGRSVGWLVTYLLVCVAWVPFRAADLGSTLKLFGGMAGLNAPTRLVDGTSMVYALVVVAGMLAGHRLSRDVTLSALALRAGWLGVAAFVALCVVLIVMHVGVGGHEFIYFQF